MGRRRSICLFSFILFDHIEAGRTWKNASYTDFISAILQLALKSPPSALNGNDVPMSTIFRGVLPFWLAMAACLGLLILFPDIALFMPSQMK